jgi:small GTP-binding protein
MYTEHKEAVGMRHIMMQIWDTAGQEHFRSLGPIYYRAAAGCIAVFDLTASQTFESLDAWIGEFVSSAAAGAVVIVIGNKLDREPRAVSAEAINEWLTRHPKYGFWETSAVTGAGVRDAFAELARMLVDANRNNMQASSDMGSIEMDDSGLETRMACC